MNPPQQPQQAYQPQQPAQYWPPQQQQQQQQQQQHHAPGEPAPPPHVSSKPMWMSKLIFRVLSAIFNIILIGLSAAVGVRWNAWGLGALIIVIPVAGLCFIWDIAESICILVRRGRRGIHPGAVVAVDLLLWLAFIVVAVFYALYYLSGDYYYYDSYYYSSYSDSPDFWGVVVGMSRAVIAFVSIQTAVHLLLFILGCYETNARNRRGPIIIYPQMQPYPMAHPMSQYGPPPGQAIMLPAGQAPPAGYMPYAYGPQQPQQPQPTHQQPQQSVSPETSTHGDPRASYQPSQPSAAGPSGEGYPVEKQENHHYG